MNDFERAGMPPAETPEAHGYVEAEQRIAELLAMPAELVDELRPQLWDIANRAASTAFTPHEKDAIHFTANVLDWELFGQPGDPLPQGLIFTDTTSAQDGGKYSVAPDARLQFGESCGYAARKQFDALGFADVRTKVRDTLIARETEIDETVMTQVIENPAYIQLQAFDMPLAAADSNEGPLTPYQRLIRSGQLEHEARQVPGGMIIDKITVYDGQPYFDLRKIAAKLDNETMRLPEQEQSDADTRKRVREYFATAFVDSYLAMAGSGEDKSEGRRAQLIHEVVVLGSKCSVLDTAPREAAYEMLTSNIPKGLDKKLAFDLLDNLSNKLFNPAYDSLPYKQLLEQAAHSTVRRVYGSLLNSSAMQTLSLRSALLKSHGEYVPADELAACGMDRRNHNHTTKSEATFGSKKDILKELDQIIGHVVSGEIKGHRIIHESLRNKNLPAIADRADVTLVLPPIMYENRDPYIPGYQLVSRDDTNGQFSFIKEAADPYLPAKALVPGAEKHDLAFQCAQLGLTGLAAGIQKTSQLTVTKLVKLVRAHSTYHLPDDQDLVAGTPAADRVGRFSAYELADFAPLVQDGKLLCQCTISDQFMQIALTPIFGEGSLSSIDGYTIDSRGIITAASHRQTILNDGSGLHILDATPPSAELPFASGAQPGLVSSLNTSLRGLWLRQRLQPPEAPKPDLSHSPDYTPLQRLGATGTAMLVAAEDAKVSQENVLEAATATLQEKTRTWLQLPLGTDKETLYMHIVKLSLDADPLRRTHDIALRARAGDVTLDEVQRLASYLMNYRESEAVQLEIKRTFGVTPYPKHIIESLENAVADIAYYLGGDIGAR